MDYIKMKEAPLMNPPEKEIRSMAKDIAENDPNMKRGFIGFLRKLGEDWIEYIYAYRCTKEDKGIPKTELAVYRCMSDLKHEYVSSRLSFNYMSGYSYMFDGKPSISNFYDTGGFVSLCFERCEGRVHIFARHSNYDEALGNDGLFRYIDVQEFHDVFWEDITRGIDFMVKFPDRVEFIFNRLKQPKLAHNPQWLKMKREDASRLFQYHRETDGSLSLTDLRTLRWNIKRGISPKKALSGADINVYGYLRKSLGGYTHEQLMEVLEYIGRDETRAHQYTAYLRNRTTLGLSNESHSARFPRDLYHAFIESTDEIEKIRDMERKKEELKAAKYIKARLERLGAVAVSDDGYSALIPTTKQEFVAYGNTMDNCVGRLNYFEKQNEGRCLIFEIFRKDEPFACLELVPDKDRKPEIRQLYLKHNAEADDDTRK